MNSQHEERKPYCLKHDSFFRPSHRALLRFEQYETRDQRPRGEYDAPSIPPGPADGENESPTVNIRQAVTDRRRQKSSRLLTRMSPHKWSRARNPDVGVHSWAAFLPAWKQRLSRQIACEQRGHLSANSEYTDLTADHSASNGEFQFVASWLPASPNPGLILTTKSVADLPNAVVPKHGQVQVQVHAVRAVSQRRVSHQRQRNQDSKIRTRCQEGGGSVSIGHLWHGRVLLMAVVRAVGDLDQLFRLLETFEIVLVRPASSFQAWSEPVGLS